MPSGDEKEERPEEQGCVQAATCHTPAPERCQAASGVRNPIVTQPSDHSRDFPTLIHAH